MRKSTLLASTLAVLGVSLGGRDDDAIEIKPRETQWRWPTSQPINYSGLSKKRPSAAALKRQAKRRRNLRARSKK